MPISRISFNTSGHTFRDIYAIIRPLKGNSITNCKHKPNIFEYKELLVQQRDFLRAPVQALVQAALEAEMTQAIGPRPTPRRPTAI